MRISDWSSDVCSSDLFVVAAGAALFGEDGVVGISLADQADDFLLGAAVHLRDEVVLRLALDLQLIAALVVLHDEVAGGAGGGNSNVDQRVHDGPEPVKSGEWPIE